METVVEITGVNGDVVVLAGEHAGMDGMVLASDMSGFYDPEVKVVTRSPANRPGTRFVSHRVLERTVVFRVDIYDDEGPGRTWRERDTRWRRLWAYNDYTRIRVVTDDGERTLKARLESIEVPTEYDPHVNSVNQVLMTVVADDPFWYAPDEIHNVTVNGSAVIPVLMANPTENAVFPVWVLEAPGKWSVPDWSKDDPGRMIPLPEFAAGSHTVVDTDPGARQLQAVNKDPVWHRMNGVRFRNFIPGYTGKVDFALKVVADGPRQAQLRLRRPFNRPWGA